MTRKFGEHTYDLGRFLTRGRDEFSLSLFTESNIIVRDYSGVYGRSEHRDVEPSQADREIRPPTLELEHDEPELDR